MCIIWCSRLLYLVGQLKNDRLIEHYMPGYGGLNMKIKRIEKITDYGILKNYDGCSTKKFRRNNIIFGWNYSGKTTLSRIFRSLEKRQVHPDFADGAFVIGCDNENRIHSTDLSEHTLKVRVFNNDYVRENLEFEKSPDDIEPIMVMLGEENIGLQRVIKRLEDNNVTLLEKLEGLKSAKSKKQKTLDAESPPEAIRSICWI